jgi:hypothetical protein
MADHKLIQIDPLLMLDYMYWGHDRVVDGARRLSETQLTAPVRPGFLSTLELLVHLMGQNAYGCHAGRANRRTRCCRRAPSRRSRPS